MVSELKVLASMGDYETLIRQLRVKLNGNPRLLTDPFVKEWLGKRWRHLFLREAVEDQAALKTASRFFFETRPPMRRIAERFLSKPYRKDWEIEMPAAKTGPLKNVDLLFCPGMLNGIFPVPAFKPGLVAASEMLPNVLRSLNHPLRGCDPNVANIHEAITQGIGLDASANVIDEQARKPLGDFFVIAYSKGSPDLLSYLVEHPEIAQRIRCIFLWCGATGGSPLGDGVYKRIKNWKLESLNKPMATILKPFIPKASRSYKVEQIEDADIVGAFKDITTEARGDFNEKYGNRIDRLDIPIFSMAGAAKLIDVPLFQMFGYLRLRWLLGDNDMQVPVALSSIDIPMATELGRLRGHHWDLAYSAFIPASFTLSHKFPKKAAIIAMIRLTAELGLID